MTSIFSPEKLNPGTTSPGKIFYLACLLAYLLACQSPAFAYVSIDDVDINSDQTIDETDYFLFRIFLSTNSTNADFNGDGSVTGLDYSLLRSFYGQDVIPGITELYSLPANSFGHPQLRWKNSTAVNASYEIVRRSDETDPVNICPNGSTPKEGFWCSVSNYSLSVNQDITQFTDNEVSMDPAFPTEHQYRIKVTNPAGQSSDTTSWASHCDINIDGSTALSDWVTAINNYPMKDSSNNAITLTVNDLPVPTEETTFTPFDGGNFYFLSNDKYIVLFSRRSGLLGYTHRAYGGELINVDRTSTRGSWIIGLNELANEQPINIIGGSSEPVETIYDATTGELNFRWLVNGLTVNTYWSLTSYGSTGLHARIDVTGTATGTGYAGKGIEHVRFPFITGMGFPNVDIYQPGKAFGLKENDFPAILGQGRTLELLNSAQQAQFVGLGDGTQEHHLMYFASEDGAVLPKKFRVQPHVNNAGQPNNTSATEIYLYATNGAGVVGNTFSMDYDTVLTPMCGDWARIGKRYRRFALQQDWLKVPESQILAGGNPNLLVTAKTVDRTDIPQKLRDGVFWWSANNGPFATYSAMEWYMNDVLKNYIGPSNGIATGMHLYNWHSPEFDTNYPEFSQRFYCGTVNEVPANCVLDMYDVVSQVQADGTLVMPYINATNAIITDRGYPQDVMFGQSPEAPDGSWGWWTRPFFAANTVAEVPLNLILRKTPLAVSGGTPVLSHDIWYNTLETFTRMDLSSPFWQQVQDFNVGNVYGYGALGVYLDTLGSGYVPDYANLHGYSRPHPVGHSDYWVNASKAITANVKSLGLTAEAQLANGQAGKRFNAAEHFNEVFINDIDVFTVYSLQPPNLIPLIATVYSDYQIFAGPQLRVEDTSEARSFRLARGFLWGSQLGLTSLEKLQGIEPQINLYSDCLVEHTDGDGIDCDIPNIEYAKDLAAARFELKRFLAYGEFLSVADDARTEAEITLSKWCVDQECETYVPATFSKLQATRWLSQNGEQVIIMTNPTRENIELELPVPANWRGHNISCYTPDALNGNCTTETTADDAVTVTLSPFDIRYIQFVAP